MLVSPLLGVDDIAPIQVAPAQALDKDLGGGGIGGKGNLILVTEPLDLIDIQSQLILLVTHMQHLMDIQQMDMDMDAELVHEKLNNLLEVK